MAAPPPARKYLTRARSREAALSSEGTRLGSTQTLGSNGDTHNSQANNVGTGSGSFSVSNDGTGSGRSGSGHSNSRGEQAMDLTPALASSRSHSEEGARPTVRTRRAEDGQRAMAAVGASALVSAATIRSDADGSTTVGGGSLRQRVGAEWRTGRRRPSTPRREDEDAAAGPAIPNGKGEAARHVEPFHARELPRPHPDVLAQQHREQCHLIQEKQHQQQVHLGERPASTDRGADTLASTDEALSISTASFEERRRAAIESAAATSTPLDWCPEVTAFQLPPDLGLVLHPDDPDGHIQCHVGEGLGPAADMPTGRYQILAPLGSGTFGKVFSCWDRSTEQLVAVKVIRAVRKYAEAARVEIDVLLSIARTDPTGRFHCARLLSYFTHCNGDGAVHVCLVFEHLGPSLFDILTRNHFRPLPLPILRSIARQLLEAIAFLHDQKQIVHTDIKPENILVVPSSYYPSRQITEHVEIRLIDFGSASRLDKHPMRYAIVSTRHYRAPEIILGTGWSYACDLWSFGAMLVECYTGQTLFQSHDDLEHLRLMQKLLQREPRQCLLPPPRPSASSNSMSSNRRREALKLFRDGRLNWPDGIDSNNATASSVARQKSMRRVARMPELETIFAAADADLLDLVRRCLCLDPSMRWTARDLLWHPFFRPNAWAPVRPPVLSSPEAQALAWLRQPSRRDAREPQQERME